MSGETVTNVQLTIESVTSPGSLNLPAGVLGEALKIEAKRASELYTELAGTVLARLRSDRGRIAQEVANLKQAIEKLEKREASLVAAMKAADGSKGIFPLTAELDLKQLAIEFCKKNGIVVPPSDSDVWKA